MIELSSSLISALLIIALLLGNTWAGCRYLKIIGVLGHELCHWVVALLMKGRPNGISLRITPPYISGEVAFNPTWINAGFVALAPLIQVLIGVSLIVGTNDNILGGLIKGIVAGVLIYTGIPSVQDLWIAVKYPLSSIVAITGVFLTLSEILIQT